MHETSSEIDHPKREREREGGRERYLVLVVLSFISKTKTHKRT